MGQRFTEVLEAAERLREGGVVAFATETVYGLGARFDSASAIAKIFQAKGRPSDNPLIVHCARVAELTRVCREITSSAEQLLAAFSPGPLTVILPRRECVSNAVTAGLDTVAVRIPRHSLAVALIDAVGVPLVAPSANRSGRPSPTTWQSVMEDLGDQIDGVLIGEPTEIGLESTVVDCSEWPPTMLRPGGITLEQLQVVLPEVTCALASNVRSERSPGLRHRHYAPKARLVLFAAGEFVAATPDTVCLGLSVQPESERFAEFCRYNSVVEYAHDLFEAFRRADRASVSTIYCERVERNGLGLALMDRLERAAAASN